MTRAHAWTRTARRPRRDGRARARELFSGVLIQFYYRHRKLRLKLISSWGPLMITDPESAPQAISSDAIDVAFCTQEANWNVNMIRVGFRPCHGPGYYRPSKSGTVPADDCNIEGILH